MMVDSYELMAQIKKKGFTQQDIADKLGINVVTLNRKIKNKNEFLTSELYRLSEILDIPIDSPIFFSHNVTNSNYSNY